MWIVNWNGTWFVAWIRDFVDDVLFEKFKVQLFLSAGVEGEPAYLAFDFAILGSVSVILGASGSKLDNVVARFEFTGEFTEMIARGREGFTGTVREDDGVGVEVEDAFGGYSTESFSVEFELCPAGGETGHEDVDVGLNGLFVIDLFVDDFDHLVVHDAKGLHDVRVIVQEFVESSRFRDTFDLTLVTLLPVLAPETVEHHFGERPPTGIFLDVGGLKLDSFLVQVLLHVLGTFVLIVTHPLGPSAGFLFHLEKGVDVGGEHGVGIGGKMPYFVHVTNDVPLMDGFLEFGGGPGANETTFFFGVDAMMTAFGQGFRLFLFHTLSAQGKGEFSTTAMRKDWVVEMVGRKNLALDQPKVRSDVGATRFVEDSGMSYWVETILVGPRVEGREVVVVDLFSLLGHVVQFDGIGATAEKGVSGLEPGHEFEGIDQGTDRFVVSLQLFPFALPHDDDTVPQREQDVFFASGGFVDVAHALIV